MNLFPSFGFLPKEGRPSLPSASFGKLHLWRGGGFLKEARRPSASFGKLHLWRLPEGREEASPLAAFCKKLNLFLNVLRKASPLAA